MSMVFLKEIMMLNDNLYVFYRVKVFRVYLFIEKEKLFLFRFEDVEFVEKWMFRLG